ncbi:MAG TPA: NADP-dependent oxidoreductase [Candidatus Sulfotelmatobacter sp.]|nr:NADP-dependent oxidoreductase [Candidatus Sulfotelmatobacter sp.]
MKAVVLTGFGGVDKLEFKDVDNPKAGAGEVLVRMRATSVNPVDWKIRSGASRGRIDVELPAILGRDLAGEVEHVGDGVSGFKKGQRVMALANHTYAELATAKAEVLTPIPDGLSFEAAAALPLVSLTGTQLVERAVKIQSGQTVLITGALGGVGRSAVHAALKHGAKVIAGVRKQQVEEARRLGAQQVVAIDDEQEIGKLHDLDAVADTVGGKTATQLLKTLKKGGVFGSVLGAPAGADQYDVRVEAFMAQPDAARLAELAKDAASGDFAIPIAKAMPLKQAGEAQSEAEQGRVHGKIVLKIA